MEGKGGSQRWCTGGAHDNQTVIDRIMLRYRPIAPKPVTGESASGGLLGDNKNSLISSKRSKRKYDRVRKNNGYRRKNNKKAEMVTLQLLPDKERVDSKDLVRRSESWFNEKVVWDNGEQDPWLGFGVGEDQTVVVIVVESWVTGACMEMEGRGLGSEDVEIMKNLEKDTCPGFISEGGLHQKAKWVNDAYKEMVMGSNETNISNGKLSYETVVVMKEKLPLPCLFTWVTCRVSVQYTRHKEKYSKMVPCDVRRMECGGYAWRLDVDAALSLAR